jgi:hypothetical protein
MIQKQNKLDDQHHVSVEMIGWGAVVQVAKGLVRSKHTGRILCTSWRAELILMSRHCTLEMLMDPSANLP